MFSFHIPFGSRKVKLDIKYQVTATSNARFWVWGHVLVNLVAMAFLFHHELMFAMGLEFQLVSSKIAQRNSLQLRFFCFGAWNSIH